jgi:glycosyltransferase involved in cell wall biosynthesis
VRIALDLRCVYKGMGGIGRYSWNMFKALLEIDRDNEYICYFTRLDPPEVLKLPERVRVRHFDAGMIDERFDQLVLPTLLVEGSIDVYHNPTFSVPAVRTSARTVATVHDVVFRRHPELVEAGLRRYLDRATRRTVNSADAIITVSHFSKREIAELYTVEQDRITVIHNGVILPCGRKPNNLGSTVQRGLGANADGYVLYVGSIEPKKNIDVLLRAFASLRRPQAARSYALVLAGASNASNYRVEDRIRELGLSGAVSVLGYVSEEDLESLYTHAKAFVYPSLYEGFGLPVLEAMARGIPTVVSRATSLPEVAGECALLFEPSDPEDLARMLTRLLESPTEQKALSEKGRARAAAFTWRHSARLHLDTYERVVKKHAHTASCI